MRPRKQPGNPVPAGTPPTFSLVKTEPMSPLDFIAPQAAVAERLIGAIRVGQFYRLPNNVGDIVSLTVELRH
jgi:hypothetical protein